MILFVFIINLNFCYSIGSLVLGMTLYGVEWPCYVIAGWTMSWGVVYVVVACCMPNFDEDKLKLKVQKDLEQTTA
jgi:hypothetical protein